MGIGNIGNVAGYSVYQAATKDFNYRAANDGKNMDPTMIDTESKSAISRQATETLKMAKEFIKERKEDSFVHGDMIATHREALKVKAQATTEARDRVANERREALVDEARKKKPAEAKAIAEYVGAKSETSQRMKAHRQRMEMKAKAETAAENRQKEQIREQSGVNFAANRNGEEDMAIRRAAKMHETQTSVQAVSQPKKGEQMRAARSEATKQGRQPAKNAEHMTHAASNDDRKTDSAKRAANFRAQYSRGVEDKKPEGGSMNRKA